jgi:hypothetical protein
MSLLLAARARLARLIFEAALDQPVQTGRREEPVTFTQSCACDCRDHHPSASHAIHLVA